MLFSTALNGMGVARLRYYSAIRYAVKAPQENTMVEILIAAVLGLFGGAKAEKIEVEISTAQDIEEARKQKRARNAKINRHAQQANRNKRNRKRNQIAKASRKAHR